MTGMTREPDSVLEQCLSQLAAGKASLADCLARYPDQAGDLGSLLLAAEAMWAIPKPMLSSDGKARIEKQLLDAVGAQPRPHLAVLRRPRSCPRLRWATIALGAMLMLILVMAVLVDTVGETLPGSALHSLKLAAEDTVLLVAPGREQPKLHLRFAHRRLVEVENLTVRGSVDLSAVDAMSQQTEAVLAAVEGLPPAKAVPLVDDLIILIRRQERTLSDLLDGTPTASQERVAAALQVAGQQADRTRALIGSLPMPPSIAVSETANPSRVPEPGGAVEFVVRVTNDGAEDITITSLTNVIRADPGQSTCSIPSEGRKLAPGESYECAFGMMFFGNAGDSQSDVVTVIAVDDEGNTAQVSKTAVVSIEDVQPVISVANAAIPGSVPEPGGLVQFTVRVTNRSIESVVLKTLVHSEHGDLDGRGSCSVLRERVVLEPGQYYECVYSADLFGNAGDDIIGTVTAVVADDEGNNRKAASAATVTVSDLLPKIRVSELSTPGRVPEPGGTAQFKVRIGNDSVEDVVLISLMDSVSGDLDGRGTCSVPAEGVSVKPGAWYECSYGTKVSGNAGDSTSIKVEAIAADDEGNRTRAENSAKVSIDDVLPAIAVIAMANTGSVPEPGGTVQFTVRVTNHSVENVVLRGLLDGEGRDLSGWGSCSVAPDGMLLGPKGEYRCTFSAPALGDAGDSVARTVTATAADDESNIVEAGDDVTIAITDVLPEIVVSESVTPGRVPEPGGTVQYKVRVTNNSAEAVTLTALKDGGQGNLSGRGDCSLPKSGLTLGVNQSYQCAFSAQITGNAGASQSHTVVATASDNEGNVVESSAVTKVSIADVLPSMAVIKTANPSSAPEPGGIVLFTVRVSNNSVEEVVLASLTDSIHGDLGGRGTCSLPPAGIRLSPAAAYQCTFSASVAGNGGDTQTGAVTAQAADDEGNKVKASGSATVTIADVVPVIQVIVTANRTSLPEPGGLVRFTVQVTSSSVEDVKLVSLVDKVHGDLNGRGTCSVPSGGIVLRPGGSYKCAYDAALAGNAGTAATNIVTAEVSDDERNRVKASSSAAVQIADVKPVISLLTTASPKSVPEPGDTVQFAVQVTNNSVEAVQLISLRDSMHGDLNGLGTCSMPPAGIRLKPGGVYACVFAATLAGNAGDTGSDTVTARVSDDEGNQTEASGSATVGISDVLPVIAVSATVQPSSIPEPGGTVQFMVRVTNNSVEGVRLTSLADSLYGALTGRGTCNVPAQGIALGPGESYSCAFSADFFGNPGDTQTNTVVATASDDDGNSVRSSSAATVRIEDVKPIIAVTKMPSPSTVSEPGGAVHFTVRIANNGVEQIRLISIVDDNLGDLNDQGDCSVPPGGITLVVGGWFECRFRADISGNAGDVKISTVKAVVVDDEGNRVEASGSATVSVADVTPVISMAAMANPASVSEPGGEVGFTVRISNNSVEAVRLVSLVDETSGSLSGRGTCSLPPGGVQLGPGAVYECTLPIEVRGNAGESRAVVLRAAAVDDEGNQAECSTNVTVSIVAPPAGIVETVSRP